MEARKERKEERSTVGQGEGAVCYPSSVHPVSQLPAAYWISLSLWPTELFLALHTPTPKHKHPHILCILTSRCIHTVIHKQSGTLIFFSLFFLQQTDEKLKCGDAHKQNSLCDSGGIAQILKSHWGLHSSHDFIPRLFR